MLGKEASLMSAKRHSVQYNRSLSSVMGIVHTPDPMHHVTAAAAAPYIREASATLDRQKVDARRETLTARAR